jgi:DNA-binding transcriptional LysR family regulator
MHPAELQDHRCITSLNRNMSTLKPQWQFSEKNYPLYNVIEVDSLLAQHKLIHLGAGVGRMPEYFIRKELETGALIELFADIEKPSSYVYLLYPDVQVLPKKTQLFMEFVKQLHPAKSLRSCGASFGSV